MKMGKILFLTSTRNNKNGAVDLKNADDIMQTGKAISLTRYVLDN